MRPAAVLMRECKNFYRKLDVAGHAQTHSDGFGHYGARPW